MSENPMDGYGAPGPSLSAESAPAGRDPKVLIGGGIGLALVAAIGAYLFLGGGGGGSAAPTAVTPVHHVTPTTTPSATVVPVGKPTPAVRTFNGDVGRDPFAALITSPPPPAPKVTKAVTPATPPTAAPTVVITSGPGNVVAPPGGTTVTVAPVPTATPTSSAPTAVLVVLKAITFHGPTPYVMVTDAGKSYLLKTGDIANGTLKVMAIAADDGTATFQLGDQTFDLHIGQSFVD